jgi:hypothetical protein
MSNVLPDYDTSNVLPNYDMSNVLPDYDMSNVLPVSYMYIESREVTKNRDSNDNQSQNPETRPR